MERIFGTNPASAAAARQSGTNNAAAFIYLIGAKNRGALPSKKRPPETDRKENYS